MHKTGVGPGVDGGFDAVDHLGLRHQLLARTMPATLGPDLVLDVHRRGAELDQRLDGAGDVEGRGAETGVDVD